MSTRLVIEASWRAAQRHADAEGVLRGTASTIAGQYLAAAGGDARNALAMVPICNGEFWRRVRATLADVEAEEATRKTGS